jgi:tRNA G10  N-methylase Trm11
MVIKSVYYNQEELIKSIIDLHIKDNIEVDTTYSKGNFYKNDTVNEPIYKFDKFPINDTILHLEDVLPFENNSINSIMFDPPFVISKGKSLDNTVDGQNIISNRFSYFESPKELFNCYTNNMIEYYRVLKERGFLIFKCQDTVSSGKNYFTHVWIMNKALEIGFYPKDLFILVAKNRVISGKHKNQQHARKYHSYFWVLEKIKSKINYNNF